MSAFPRPSLGGRESLAGGRPSTGRPSSVGVDSLRNSLGGGRWMPCHVLLYVLGLSLCRRSSVYVRSGPAKLQDPRPLSDRSYLAGCGATVLQYCTTHGYDKTIGPKQMQHPNSTDFRNWLQFIVSQIDPTFVIPEKKFEDQVVNWFKLVR
jgi:hypothetical protein